MFFGVRVTVDMKQDFRQSGSTRALWASVRPATGSGRLSAVTNNHTQPVAVRAWKIPNRRSATAPSR